MIGVATTGPTPSSTTPASASANTATRASRATRLLDEHVPRTTRHPRRPRPRHHLHRQDAVAAQLEERIVHPDPIHPQHLGVDARQDLLDRVRRGAGSSLSPYSGAGRARTSSLPLTVSGSAVDHHHRRRHHVASAVAAASAARSAAGSDCRNGIR